jgi:hypothetical protein
VTEWYVYMENGQPKMVILGRAHALTHLTTNFRLTPAEKRRLGFVRESMPDLGQVIQLVGYEVGLDNRVPDRAIVRVVGPGTEV